MKMCSDLARARKECKVFTRWFGSLGELKHNAVVAQLVEHHLAKVDVASSSLVNRSLENNSFSQLRPRSGRVVGWSSG